MGKQPIDVHLLNQCFSPSFSLPLIPSLSMPSGDDLKKELVQEASKKPYY